jgi:hypothetical protein
VTVPRAGDSCLHDVGFMVVSTEARAFWAVLLLVATCGVISCNATSYFTAFYQNHSWLFLKAAHLRSVSLFFNGKAK